MPAIDPKELAARSSTVITTRQEHPGDVGAIRRVHEAAFPTSAEADLVDRLRANDRLIVSLVALADNEIVGHAAFSPVTIEGCESIAPGLGIAPMAVLPDFQRQGIGSQIVHAGLMVSQLNNWPYVVVLGHAKYYPRFGFQRASDYGLGNEYGVGEEFMVLELQSGCLSGCQGTVKYGPELK